MTSEYLAGGPAFFLLLFIEQNSTQDCCFRFFIYKNPSALAYQGCQQSLYNKDNKQVELTYLDQLTIIKLLYNNS